MAHYLTLSQLVNKVLVRISQVSGTGTQVYAEDRIADMIQHKFDILFDLAFWDQFTAFSQFTLDGTNGTITADLTDLIKRLEDIKSIFIENSNTAIPKLSLTTNPFNFSGTQPRAFSGNSDETKVLTVWPKTSTGIIEVVYRTLPTTFEAEETIKFDPQALILGSVYEYLEDDGTNPNATQKFQGMFDARVSQLIKLYNSHPVGLDNINTIPTGFDFVELP
jgi:hypothetical protein